MYLHHLVVLVILLTSSASATEFEHPQAGELARTLRLMQEQEADNFVIVEVPGSENYFQFSAEGEGYIFDVPMMSFNAAQLDRAKGYFAAEHVELVIVVSENPKTGENFRLESYQRQFKDQEIAAGVELGFGFMLNVLHHHGNVIIIRGWE